MRTFLSSQMFDSVVEGRQSVLSSLPRGSSKLSRNEATLDGTRSYRDRSGAAQDSSFPT